MSVISAFASESVQFKLNDCTTDNNRLFTVKLTATANIKLCAVTFEFKYDKNMLEFKSAKTDDKSKINYYENNDNVKIVYLNTYGNNIENGEVILDLTFKSINTGVSYIDFFVSDCVDSSISNVEIGNCTSAKIVVNGKNNSSNKNNNTEYDKNNDSEIKSKSSRDNVEATTFNASIDELGVLNPLSVNNKTYLLIGIFIGISIILLVGMGFFIGKRVQIKNHNNNENIE